MLKKIVFVFVLLAMMGCQQESREWNPIFENTGFEYFYDKIDRALASIKEAGSEAETADLASVQQSLTQAQKYLLAIKDYYVPLTAIRQKVYDAERFFKLENGQEAENLLNDSKELLKLMDSAANNKAFDGVVLKLESMIDEAILSLDDDSDETTHNKLKILGEHVNLMLSRGDLVLSGVGLNS